MNSGMVFAGTDGCTTTTPGTRMMPITGAMSRMKFGPAGSRWRSVEGRSAKARYGKRHCLVARGLSDRGPEEDPEEYDCGGLVGAVSAKSNARRWKLLQGVLAEIIRDDTGQGHAGHLWG